HLLSTTPAPGADPGGGEPSFRPLRASARAEQRSSGLEAALRFRPADRGWENPESGTNPRRQASPSGAERFAASPGVAALGPLPLDAAVGDGAGGLQPRRQRLGLHPLRALPQPCLSLGRGRDPGYLR